MGTPGLRRRLTRLSRCTLRRAVVILCIAAGAAGASLFAQSSTQHDSASSPHDSGTYYLTGRVVRVADGDTLTVVANRKRARVRTARIDAPRFSHRSARHGRDHGE